MRLTHTLPKRPRHVYLEIETLEDRLALSWAGIPPAVIPPPSSAQAVVLNSQGDAAGTGAITRNENDFYTFVPRLSGSYRLSVRTPTSNLDPVLGVYSARGGRIGYNDDISRTNTDSRVAVNLTAGRRYYFGVSNYTGRPGGGYTWVVDRVTTTGSFSRTWGYGLVDAGRAVARAIGRSNLPDVANFGGRSDWNLNRVRAPEAWARGYTGRGVVVAVVDSGVDYNHWDLDNNIWVNPREALDGFDNDGNGFIDDVIGWDFVGNENDPMDEQGHGTHVAGTIAAESNGYGYGITGVAPQARIMPVRVLGADGQGSFTNIAAGIRYAATMGADVINLSLTGGYSADIDRAVRFAVGRGCVVVMASGNEGNAVPAYPARLATTVGIAVGAVDEQNRVATFSNRAGATRLDYVVGPGVEVLSTIPNSTLGYKDGTSMATPHVAGIAALMLSANPRLTPAQIESLLCATANPNGIRIQPQTTSTASGTASAATALKLEIAPTAPELADVTPNLELLLDGCELPAFYVEQSRIESAEADRLATSLRLIQVDDISIASMTSIDQRLRGACPNGSVTSSCTEEACAEELS